MTEALGNTVTDTEPRPDTYWRTRTGMRYHRASCDTTAEQVTTEVTDEGIAAEALTPCGVCHPPTVANVSAVLDVNVTRMACVIVAHRLADDQQATDLLELMWDAALGHAAPDPEVIARRHGTDVHAYTTPF